MNVTWRLAVWYLACACAAMSQTSRGTVTGTVIDASGAVVPNARLSLTGVDTGVQLSTDSNHAGVYRFDQLVVLKMTRMPAVLIEAGSIINRPEELELGTPERRAKTSAAIVSAVEDFCSARTSPKTAQQMKRPENSPRAKQNAVTR